MLAQLILTMKRQTTTLDKEATRALLEFNDQLNDNKISTTNVEKSKTILSEKVGKERAIYKLKLREQLAKLTDNYKTIKTNMHFLKNMGPVTRNKPSLTAPRSSSPSWRKKFAPSKKNSLLNRGNQSNSTHFPKENRALTSATAISRARGAKFPPRISVSPSRLGTIAVAIPKEQQVSPSQPESTKVEQWQTSRSTDQWWSQPPQGPPKLAFPQRPISKER